MTTSVFDAVETVGRPEISRAVARGDLPSVRRIVETASATSEEGGGEYGGGRRTRIINAAARWREERHGDVGGGGGDDDVTRCASPPFSGKDHHPNDDNGRDRHSAAQPEPAGGGWFDVTPVTLAAMRGRDDIVEYLLRAGADPTLSGCPRDDCVAGDGDGGGPPLAGDRPDLHMDAFDAAGGLSAKIRRCRRTRDLLMAVRPFWKKVAYSGSSAARHGREKFTNAPLSVDLVLEAIGEVPKLADYPLKARNFDEDVIDTAFWKKRKMDLLAANARAGASSARDVPPHLRDAVDEWVEIGQPRRCFSCGELKTVQSYGKNEKRKGVEARCISCVATNPEALDLPAAKPSAAASCKAPKLNDGH